MKPTKLLEALKQHADKYKADEPCLILIGLLGRKGNVGYVEPENKPHCIYVYPGDIYDLVEIV